MKTSSEKIDSRASISKSAGLGKNVQVGPFSLIEDSVEIGENTIIGSHCLLAKNTIIGKNSRVYSYTCIGSEPQDLSYLESNSFVVIGNNTIIREFCSIQKASKKNSQTFLGDNCLLMNYAHIGHDCKVANNVVIANGTTLGGHVEIGNFVNLSAQILIHQFCRVGEHTIVSGGCRVNKDLPPYVTALDNSESRTAKILSLNLVGLRRAKLEESIESISRAYRIIKNKEKEVALKKIEEELIPEYLRLAKLDSVRSLKELVSFYRNSERGVARFIKRTQRTQKT